MQERIQSYAAEKSAKIIPIQTENTEKIGSYKNEHGNCNLYCVSSKEVAGCSTETCHRVQRILDMAHANIANIQEEKSLGWVKEKYVHCKRKELRFGQQVRLFRRNVRRFFKNYSAASYRRKQTNEERKIESGKTNLMFNMARTKSPATVYERVNGIEKQIVAKKKKEGK